MTQFDETKVRFITSNKHSRNVIYLTATDDVNNSTIFVYTLRMYVKEGKSMIYVNNYSNESIKICHQNDHAVIINCFIPFLHFSKFTVFNNIYLILN